MDISIIIVNYNVKYFLEQCLYSVQYAIPYVNAEVFVVDNASNDDSMAYLKPKFTWVNFIESATNVGFAKANNLALPLCKGKYILYLNPDTLIPTDCLLNCINFYAKNNNCGGLGVQMIDGAGKFLPESKRGNPTLTAAFFKLFGISSVFPNSKFFNQYALSYLPYNQTHQVPVLAGAFLMLPTRIAQQLKGFDERFFMYGEDIDLSYCIEQTGYKNYYFGEQQIIHFKGESSQKHSSVYVKMFYQAMIIFVQKHYNDLASYAYKKLIHAAILVKGFFAYVKNNVLFLINKKNKQIVFNNCTTLTISNYTLINKDNLLHQLQQQVNSHIIFILGKNLTVNHVIELMNSCSAFNVKYSFSYQTTHYTISSSDKNSKGEIIFSKK